MITLDGVIQAPGTPGEDTPGHSKYGGWGTSFADEIGGKALQKTGATNRSSFGQKNI